MGEPENIVTLNRISLKLKNGVVSLDEDTFQTEEKDIIYKTINPEKLTGYKLTYVMKSKIGKMNMRPQDKANPTNFEHYGIYVEEEDRLKLLKQLAKSIEEKLKEFQHHINDSLIAMVQFRRDKIPSLPDDA